jgi:signal recognition particle receptor subunit beta
MNTTPRSLVLMSFDCVMVWSSENGSSSKRTTEVPVLVAANKQDLFTALPPGAVKEMQIGCCVTERRFVN